MTIERNAKDEFVHHAGEVSPAQSQVPLEQSVDAEAFEFVKQLAAELSGGTFELPACPEVALRIQAALNDPDISIDKLCQIVLAEPMLVARLLRMSNSALIRGAGNEVTDVKTAISRLGFNVVRNAAVSIAMDSAFSAPSSGVLRNQFEKTRQHSVFVATLSYILTKRFAKHMRPDEAMLAGLLHDIGHFYILTRINAFPALFNDSSAFEGLLQDWHTGVGRAIVEAWGFGELVAVAIDEHELLDREHGGKADLADVVLMANLLANHAAGCRADLPPLATLPAASMLHMDEQTCATVIEDSREEVHSMMQALN